MNKKTKLSSSLIIFIFVLVSLLVTASYIFYQSFKKEEVKPMINLNIDSIKNEVSKSYQAEIDSLRKQNYRIRIEGQNNIDTILKLKDSLLKYK